MLNKTVSRKVALITTASLAAVFILFDRLSKWAAEASLIAGPKPFIPGFIELYLTYNSGAAWGIMQGARVYFLAVAAVTVAVVLLYLISSREHPLLTAIGFGVFLGGSLGNAIDRLLTGRVVDFLHFQFIDFPIFNLADIAIFLGAALVFLSVFLVGRQSKQSAAAGKARRTADKAEPTGKAELTADEAITSSETDASTEND
jgi:signal peptidase II